MARVLVIGDTHIPAMHPAYIPFLKQVEKKWKTNRVVHIGDLVDHACISFHAKSTSNEGPINEYKASKMQIEKMHKEFPKMDIIKGNHDNRVSRIAEHVGIPASVYVKEEKDLYNVKGWNWVKELEIDGVYYFHGEGCGTVNPAYNAATHRMQSTVVGHYHSCCGIAYKVGPKNKIWGMSVGSGVDRDHWSMQYAKNYLRKPIVGCGVVIEGTPYVETMDL